MEQYKEKCPKCGSDANFAPIPPPKDDPVKRTRLVKFKCSNIVCGHEFFREFDLH